MTDEQAHDDVVGMGMAGNEITRLEQALAEKDREIQQIREHEFQNGYREGEAAAEAKYQTLLAQAVGLAETVLQGHRYRLKTLRADKFLNSPEAQAFLKEQT